MFTLRTHTEGLGRSFPQIVPLPEDKRRWRRWFWATPTARKALRLLLEGYKSRGITRVLLPGYVGWSPREGSGVMDPVREADLDVDFYRMSRALTIDLEHLSEMLAESPPSIVLIIHYFGLPDPNLHEAISLARDAEATIVEDEAHALFTDLVGGVTGRLGDASIFSLHKMLPQRTGGALAYSRAQQPATTDAELLETLGSYDLAGMARARRRNWAYLETALKEIFPGIGLTANIKDGVVPQSFPILLPPGTRDRVYARLRNESVGVVSLYHTMVGELRSDTHRDAKWLSDRILNLPLHQELDERHLTRLVKMVRSAAAVECS